MFSTRTAWDRRLGTLARRVAERRAAGAAILDLTETNPTRAGLLAPADVLALLADPRGLHYDPVAEGQAAAREAVAADYARRGFSVEPGRILLTAGTSEAYAFLFKLLCDPGDDVLVPRPSYPLFEYLATLESVSALHYPLQYDGEWHLDIDAVAEASTARTRAIVVVSPNNPTGSFLKREEAQRLRHLAAARGWAIVSDEVFADFALKDDARRPPSMAEDSAALTFALGGLSKSVGLPQLKLAWMAVAGPATEREEALARLEVVADTYLSVATPVQLAAPALLARAAELQRPILERVQANVRELKRQLATGSAATLLDLEGGWSAVLRVPAIWPDEQWALTLLERDGVLAHPGFFFDFAQEAHLVLSTLTEPQAFAEGARRLLARVEAGADDTSRA
jgi:aspartate/methionine/tyrosine aminotransferase